MSRPQPTKGSGPHFNRLTSNLGPVLGGSRLPGSGSSKGFGPAIGVQCPIPALNLADMMAKKSKTLKASNATSSVHAPSTSNAGRSYPDASPQQSQAVVQGYAPLASNYDDILLEGADEIGGPCGLSGGAKLSSPLRAGDSRHAREINEEVSKDIGS